MTQADIDRIGTLLGITVPGEYRDLQMTRAAELKGLTHELGGVTYGYFDDTLYLDADTVIETNRIERKPDSGTGYAFPDWWRTFFLLGSNGAGDYYCLRLDGQPGVWMIGSDCEEAEQVNASLAEFVEEQLKEYREKMGDGGAS
jgi:hypothetical protein